MIDGKHVKIGGDVFQVPPFNLRLLRKYDEALNYIPPKPAEGESPKMESLLEQMDRLRPALLENLQRNHPDLTAEEFEDRLDVRSFSEMMRACYDRGFRQEKPGGDAPSPSAPAE